MESVFDKTANQAINDRIQKLTPQTPAQWGKMNVNQMLVHCQKPIEVALTGEMDRKTVVSKVLSALFGKMVKNKLMRPGPLDRNSPTAPGFKIVDPNISFEQEREKLIKMVSSLQRALSASPTTRTPSLEG